MAQSYPGMPEQPAVPPKSGMSSTTKIILAILAVLGLCCIVTMVGFALFFRQVGESVQTDPEQAAQQGQDIVAYELPAGYQEEGAMNMLGLMDMVFISRGGTDTDSNMVIFLARFNIPGLDEGDTEQMKEQMQQGIGSGSGSRRSA